MDAVKKGILSFFLWSLASVALAGEGATLLSDKQEDEIINLVYSQLRASIKQLETNIDRCEILARKNVLEPKLFQSLPLTEQEKRIVLGYFGYLAQSECEDTRLWANIPLELAQLKDMEKYYKGENIIKTEQYLDIICCMISRRYFELKWEYLKIAPEVRKKLERMPELQKPFDVVQTTKIMGLL